MSKVLVKVCGVTTPEDAQMVADAGVDLLGLNFHPESPRRVSEAEAKLVVEVLPISCVAVGLFVDRKPAEVRRVAKAVGLKVVQLHGSEPPGDIKALAGLDVIKAFRLGSSDDLVKMRAYLDDCQALGAPPWAVLVDASVPGRAGGTGQTVADDLIKDLPPLERLVLAGGLAPENVAQRLATMPYRPWMVDVASGVECVPGMKDAARVTAFVKAVRALS